MVPAPRGWRRGTTARSVEELFLASNYDHFKDEICDILKDINNGTLASFLNARRECPCRNAAVVDGDRKGGRERGGFF